MPRLSALQDNGDPAHHHSLGDAMGLRRHMESDTLSGSLRLGPTRGSLLGPGQPTWRQCGGRPVDQAITRGL